MGWLPTTKKRISNRFTGDEIEKVTPIDKDKLKEIVSDVKRQNIKQDIESMEFQLNNREDK